MIASMTGFSRSEVKRNGREVTVEIRSLNNRFLDISVRLTKTFSIYEDEIRNIIRQNLIRGRINVTINIKESNGDRNSFDKANIDLAKIYLKKLKNIQQELNINGEIKIEHLLAFPDIFLLDETEEISDESWNDTKEALLNALNNLKRMRLNEGKQLNLDFVKRIKNLDESIKQIEELSELRVENERNKLKERIASLELTDEIDENRMEFEIATLASRMDVTEECIRFKSHNKIFLDILKSDGAVGRKLNFLLQEMTREANTMGSKAYDADIAHLVVNIKEEIEKIREQVQNIE